MVLVDCWSLRLIANCLSQVPKAVVTCNGCSFLGGPVFLTGNLIQWQMVWFLGSPGPYDHLCM